MCLCHVYGMHACIWCVYGICWVHTKVLDSAKCSAHWALHFSIWRRRWKVLNRLQLSSTSWFGGFMKNHLRGFAGACFPAFFANWFSTAKPLVDYKRYHRPKQFTQAEYMISFVIIFISITSCRGSQRLLLGCDDRDACGACASSHVTESILAKPLWPGIA